MAIPIPRWAYVPGGDVEPDRAALEQAKSFVPRRFEGFVPWQHAALLYGLVLNDSEFYWESHEVLEAVWKAAPMNGLDRIVLQALIQTANAGLKQRMGRHAAAGRLVMHAQELLGEFIFRKRAADIGSLTASLAGRLRSEAFAEQLSHWRPSVKLSLSALLLSAEPEQKCIEEGDNRWTTTVSCIIMQNTVGEAHGG
ncbi:MAG: DUF309 domain-containing protein [Methylobacteriaceae bacterium]|nr:DUF309 domain-containing protein [Methylobacteriaceae bacterium]